MSLNDPIADMLTRLRNGLRASKDRVDIPASNIKEDMCKVLEAEGYIRGYKRVDDGKQGLLQVALAYTTDGNPVIRELTRVSRPSLRNYAKQKDVQQFRSGLGIRILTTSHGVMTDKQARESNVGGEVLCEIW
jgi:small subunit ribosomal protein S8